MAQEDSKKEVENPSEAPSEFKPSEKDDGKKDVENPIGVENSSEAPSEFKPSEKDDGKKVVENPPEGTAKQSLKAKSKIVKKSQVSKWRTKRNKGNQQIQGRGNKRRKNTKSPGNEEIRPSGNDYVEKQCSKDSQYNGTAEEQPKQENQLAEKSHQAQKNKKKITKSDKSLEKKKNKGKNVESSRHQGNTKYEDKHASSGKRQSNEKKEKLGGLILMCNSKTKLDCFRYRVMGISTSKKDIVLGIKPGLKLFLFDFDLKLLYGTYRASSSGGMRLEPRAFGGSFPVQVRFNIDKDCFPLPESIFRKAIKENYDVKNKFKTELTLRQVMRLTELFRPITFQPVRSPPKAIIRDSKVPYEFRGSWAHSLRDVAARDHNGNSRVNSYNALSYERDHRIEQREEPRDLFLTEKDYRAYGLQDRRNVTSPSHVSPVLDPYKRDYEIENLHLLDHIYRDNVPTNAETLCTDPLYLNEGKYKAYGHGPRHDYLKYPYYAHHYGASREPYLPPLSREEIPSSSYLIGERTLIESANLPRREAIQDSHYSTYAAEALSDYNQTQQYHRAKPEDTLLPVSSRYSFAGPSYHYR